MRAIKVVGLACAVLTVAACSHANREQSEIAGHPRTRGGMPIVSEMPGSQGPVADYGFVRVRNAATEVKDETTTVAASPVVTPAPEARPVVKAKPRAQHKHYRGAVAVMPTAPKAKKVVTANRAGVTPMLSRAVALNHLHHINQKELAMARLAKSKSSSARVTAVANQMIMDHENLERRVAQAAERQGVLLEKFQPATHEHVAMEELERKDGRAFDRAFLNSVQGGHKLTLSELRMIRSDTRDPAIRQMVNATIPDVREHVQLSTGANRRGAN